MQQEVKMLELSPGQIEAKQKVLAWLAIANSEPITPTKPLSGSFDLDADLGAPVPQPKGVFKLHGYAGTGKTTIIRAILAEQPDLVVCFAAYTGKAALVMQRQGLEATTIHSLIYKVIPPNKPRCEELFKLIRETADAGEKKRLQQELEVEQKIRFELKDTEESDLAKADLLVLDECSMVNDDMLADLQTFGVPILALGDPGQLPPIDGSGALVRGKPDAFLTEIHRQAQDNPIIDFATRARNGIPLPTGKKGSSLRCFQYQLDRKIMLAVDQILTGKNVTRQDINRRVRAMRGFSGVYPQVGEKVICLRNDRNKMIFNGQIGEVVEVGELLHASIELKVKMEGAPGTNPEPIDVRALRAHFDSYNDKEALKNVKRWEFADSQEFDFGYAITVHKAQGSQWDNVLVWDDGFLNWKAAERKQWLYTAITRAAQSIIIAS